MASGWRARQYQDPEGYLGGMGPMQTIFPGAKDWS